MKKSINILWYLLFFLLFPILFYKQAVGINVLVYGIALVLFWISVFGEKAKSATGFGWLLANLVCAISVALYGNFLALLSLIVVVFTTAVFFNQNNVNPISSTFAGLITFVTSPFNLRKGMGRERGDSRLNGTQILVYIVLPASILVTFAILYAMSDSLFADLLNKIDLDIFNLRFLITLFIGLLTIYTIAFTQVSRKKARLEKWAGKNAGDKDRFPIKLIPRSYEQTTGIITLALLNFLILTVIINDIRFRFLGTPLPDGITHSAYLHQGIISLIISIIWAILMLAWLFRTKRQNQKALVVLAVSWMAQNIVLVVLNALRNAQYIQEYSLTYKRIGVYFYLFAAMAGLAFTILYVVKKYNFLYLFKLNTYTILVMLIVASPIPWDQIITHYNVDQAVNGERPLDVKYLMKLKNPDLFYVYQHQERVLNSRERNWLYYVMESAVDDEIDKKLFSKTLYTSHQSKLYMQRFDHEERNEPQENDQN